MPANRASSKCADMCRSGSRQRAIHEAIGRAPHNILARVVERQLICGTVYSLAEFEYDLDMWRVDVIQSTKQPVSDEAGPTSGEG